MGFRVLPGLLRWFGFRVVWGLGFFLGCQGGGLRVAWGLGLGGGGGFRGFRLSGLGFRGPQGWVVGVVWGLGFRGQFSNTVTPCR